jgi:hypothetical protein
MTKTTKIDKSLTDKLTPEENDYYSELKQIEEQEYNYFIDLISNALIIHDLPDNVPKDWVIKSLLEKGRIGIIKMGEEEKWLPATSSDEKSDMGEPLNYILNTANGKSINININNSTLKAVIRLRPSARPLIEWLRSESMNLAFIRMSKKANLVACETAQVYECGNDKTVTEMKSVFMKRSLGIPAIFSRKEGLEGAVHNIGSNVPFIADKLNEIYTQDKNSVLSRLGILTSNSNKKERVQVGEITAQVGQVVDSIYTFIDTFNYDAERFGIPQRMDLNAVVEDYYAQENQNIGVEENDNFDNIANVD